MSQEQLVELLQRFSLEVKCIAKLKKEVSQQKMMSTTPKANPMNIVPEVLEGATASETTSKNPGQDFQTSTHCVLFRDGTNSKG